MKTKINAELLLASKNIATGDILYSWLLTYPRMILAEVNTHRMVSKNTSSSRAIPSRKQRNKVYQDPFIPVSIGSQQKGMQAGAELTGWKRRAAELVWSSGRYSQLWRSWALEKLGVHKQIANRLLEPWVWTQQVFSATEVDNFLRLRDHHMAEPHFQVLAGQMQGLANEAAYALRLLEKGLHDDSVQLPVQLLHPGQWHLPFVDSREASQLGTKDAKIVSAARCAWTSYNVPGEDSIGSLQKAYNTFSKLVIREEGSDDPMHLSPLEHPAMATEDSVYVGNFKGFKQFRKEFAGEDGRSRRVV